MEEGDDMRSKFKRVCVFCGSQSGNRKVFSDAALELGDELVKRKIDLVYGGGSVGLMGLISQKVYDGGCHVLGVIPKALMPLEISGETVGEVQIVLNMHERKAVMAREADAFIALPGGYGTMEELMEMITWSQLGIHKKPVGLLNVDGYYNSLLGLFDDGVKEGFIKPSAREIVLSAPTAQELLEKMEAHAMAFGFEAITSSETLIDSIMGSVNLKDSSVEDSYRVLAKHLKRQSDHSPLLMPFKTITHLGNYFYGHFGAGFCSNLKSHQLFTAFSQGHWGLFLGTVRCVIRNKLGGAGATGTGPGSGCEGRQLLQRQFSIM
ncbi:hypothetical protein CDL15_Pgr022120 [Punica granatum]|uniref:cytokinin riboside 5'-monophosphate phosphoribohydrolase n=1 Tax=Punica granatum TaxID=22663 RepID=A0A218VS96_PUNGR|nr:hypothetical protein CDL15_Pgr022120 [Punica granatum]